MVVSERARVRCLATEGWSVRGEEENLLLFAVLLELFWRSAGSEPS